MYFDLCTLFADRPSQEPGRGVGSWLVLQLDLVQVTLSKNQVDVLQVFLSESQLFGCQKLFCDWLLDCEIPVWVGPSGGKSGSPKTLALKGLPTMCWGPPYLIDIR